VSAGQKTTSIERRSTARSLVWVSLVDSIGTGVFLTGSIVYFTLGVHLKGPAVGFGLGIAGLVGFATTVPVSSLGDRIGPQRLLVLLQLWRFIGFCGYAFVHSFVPFVLCACFIAAGDRVASPVLQQLVGNAVEGTERARTMAFIRTTRNVGFSLGALLCGLLLAVGTPGSYRLIVVGDAISFLGAGVLLWRVRLPQGSPRNSLTTTRDKRGFGLRRVTDRRFIGLTALNGVLVLHMSILAVGIPLWVVQHTRLPHVWVSILITINTVLAVVMQIPAANRSTGPRSGGVAAVAAGFALAAGCALVGLANQGAVWLCAAVMVVALVAHTLGEVLQSIAAWTISYQLAPEDQRGLYLGVFSLGTTGQQILGPPLLTAAVIALGRVGWLILGAMLLVTGILTAKLYAARPVQGRDSYLVGNGAGELAGRSA
jgi:MFS family permease